jgi:RNA 2',3'-cyclic 3'-phosphodiesterase
MKRLFFALWPDEYTWQQCVNISNALVSPQSQPIQPANIHVTLLFLGNIDSDKEERLKQALATIQVPKITLQFDSLSFWAKPRILCLTAKESSPEIETIVETLSRMARDLSIPIDDRQFKPHVTLVKKAKTQIPLEFKPIVWQAHYFCLVESCLFSNGIEYRIVEKWGGIKK